MIANKCKHMSKVVAVAIKVQPELDASLRRMDMDLVKMPRCIVLSIINKEKQEWKESQSR